MIPTYNDGLANKVQYVYDITLPNTIDTSRDKKIVLKHSFHNQKIRIPSDIADVLFSQKLYNVIAAFFGYLGKRFFANRNCRVTVFFPGGDGHVLRFTVEYHASIHLLVMVYAEYRPDLPHVGNIICPGYQNQDAIINPVEEKVGHLTDIVTAVTDCKTRYNARVTSVIPFCLGVLIITEDYRPAVLCDFDTTVDLTAYTPNNDSSVFMYNGCGKEVFGSHPDVVLALNEHGIRDEQYIYLVSVALYQLTQGIASRIEMECCDKGILFRAVKDDVTILDWYRKELQLQIASKTQVDQKLITTDIRNQITLLYPEGCRFPDASEMSILYCDPFDPDRHITVDDYWTQFEDYISECMANTDGYSCNDDIVVTLKDTLKSVPHVLRMHMTPHGIHMSFYEEWVSTAFTPKPEVDTAAEYDNIFSGRSLRDGCIYLSGLAAVDENIRKMMKKYLKI